MKIPKLALDVDGVLANFSEGAINKANEMGLGPAFPCCWRDVKSWDMSPRFQELMRPLWGSVDFWSSLNPMPGVTREVHPEIYLTARPVPSDVTEEWLYRYKFPVAPVITVSRPEQKIDVLKELGLWLVDDHHFTVEKCLREGIKAYLYKAPYQRGYDVSNLPIVNSLEEVMDLYEKGKI